MVTIFSQSVIYIYLYEKYLYSTLPMLRVANLCLYYYKNNPNIFLYNENYMMSITLKKNSK